MRQDTQRIHPGAWVGVALLVFYVAAVVYTTKPPIQQAPAAVLAPTPNSQLVIEVSIRNGVITRMRPFEAQVNGALWRDLSLDAKRTIAEAAHAAHLELVDDRTGETYEGR